MQAFRRSRTLLISIVAVIVQQERISLAKYVRLRGV
jgi:hypothetical protein